MKKISSALISCFSKKNLKELASYLHANGVQIYSTGGTGLHLEDEGIPCKKIEDVTEYPSMLGGRVKTLHPLIMGGILAQRNHANDQKDIATYNIPLIDLVIVDLYPFEDTVNSGGSEAECIEKIDIGGVTLLRAAAKNFTHCTVISDISQYENLIEALSAQHMTLSLQQRKHYAGEALQRVALYDAQIAHYFNKENTSFIGAIPKQALRYGENPHQFGSFHGSLEQYFTQMQGKSLSYNNLLDIDASLNLLKDIVSITNDYFWSVAKHNNVCGAAIHTSSSFEAWQRALHGDQESAFGGILCTNKAVDKRTAEDIDKIFFEIIIAPSYDEDALAILSKKKNRSILQYHRLPATEEMHTNVLGGILSQKKDTINYEKWEEVGGREISTKERNDLIMANVLCKHLKSNAIAIVKDQHLIGKGCGQTSRVDALRQAIGKAKQFENDLRESVLASDAFFPFDDCVKIAKEEGIVAFIQPGGSIRDKDSISFCVEHRLAMVMTGTRHFKH